jgi:Uma2 family endonuclease
MTASPARRKATYADLEKAPEHLVAEILDGELVVTPRPASPHAFAASTIGMDVGGAHQGPAGGGRGPGGWWILYEPELHLGSHVLVPDLAGWRLARMPAFPHTAAFDLAPDWVCEVVSPTTSRIDRVRKMPICAEAGVGHVWLVDPLARLLEVFKLEGGRWVVAAAHGDAGRVRLEPFEGIELELARFWPPLEAQQP